MLVNILQSVKEWARDWSESTFLKLSGGTLTGALNGTSATFSGDISGDNATFSGDVTSLGEVEAQERIVVNANEDNYGAIRFNSENAAYDGVRFYGSNDEYGDEITVGAGGRFIAGSGESAYNLHNALIDAGETPNTEQTYIASDNHVYLFSHCQTIENRTQLMFNNSSNVALYGRCGADHEVNIGPSVDNGATGTVINIGKIEFQDKNGTWSSSIGNEANGSAGTVRTYFGLHNVKTDGTNVSQWFCIDLKKDGTVAYSVPYTANFRSAIGAAASSDRRLKHDITPLGEEAVQFVKDLEPCVYIINGEHQVGFIAQDVAESDPWNTSMAFETKEGLDGLDDWERMPDGSATWKLDYIRTIPPIAAALKKAMERIDQLEARVAELETGENNA